MVSLPGSAFANLNSADLRSTRRFSEFANGIIERAGIYGKRTKPELSGSGFLNLLNLSGSVVHRSHDPRATHEGLHTYSQDDQAGQLDYSFVGSFSEDCTKP
jgi:hypothetical protein